MFCANCGKEMQIETKRGYDIYTGETITQIAVCKNCNITREITPKQNNVTITEFLKSLTIKQKTQQIFLTKRINHLTGTVLNAERK